MLMDYAKPTSLRMVFYIYARQIVYYRDKLGGYYSVDQLLEIKNFPVHIFLDLASGLIELNKARYQGTPPRPCRPPG